MKMLIALLDDRKCWGISQAHLYFFAVSISGSGSISETLVIIFLKTLFGALTLGYNV
jgi:hypothetical protein